MLARWLYGERELRVEAMDRPQPGADYQPTVGRKLTRTCCQPMERSQAMRITWTFVCAVMPFVIHVGPLCGSSLRESLMRNCWMISGSSLSTRRR